MNAIMQRVFAHRGYTDDFLFGMEDPRHPELANTSIAISRLKSAADSGEKVIIIPDFDMDGIMSGVIGLASMSELGINAKLHVPDIASGYGFGPEEIDSIVERHPDVRLIVTCDTGITCFDGVRHATELGIDVILTDHHVPQDELPDAYVVIDPYLDENYTLKGICGAHVLWQIMMSYAKEYGDEGKSSQIERLRVFAGIGTVSDSMPMLNENRALVRDAIRIARLVWCNGNTDYVDSIEGTPFYRSAFAGLHTVLDTFHANGKFRDANGIDEDTFGFYIAPAFNSVKRMDGDIAKAFLVFLTPDRVASDGSVNDMSHVRSDLMGYLLELNERRKESVTDIMRSILSDEQPYAPYIYVNAYGGGMAGLVASRLMDESNMPTIVVSEDGDGTFEGSGRAPSWCDEFKDFVNSLGITANGHEQAFGISFDDESQMSVTFESIKEMCEKAERDGTAVPKEDDVVIGDGDGEFDASVAMMFEYADELSSYRPFGHGFELPSIGLDVDLSQGEWYAIGSDGSHAKVTMPNGMSIIVWGGADKAEEMCGKGRVRLSGKLSINEFRGRKSIDFQASGW